MYEYKVETYKVKAAEASMNKWASEGWRVIAVSPNEAVGYGLVVTYERKRDQHNSGFQSRINRKFFRQSIEDGGQMHNGLQ